MAAKNSTTRARLSKSTVSALPTPAAGHAIVWDDAVPGFGVRTSYTGTRTYFVQGRLPDGRQVKTKIGRHGTLSADQARSRAKAILGAMAAGTDPAADRRTAKRAEKERRAAPTVAEMCDRYMREHAERKKRSSSLRTDRILIEKHIKPALEARKVAEITHDDVVRFHQSIAAPIAANRALAVLSKAMSLAVRWGWRAGNPCKGVERNPEDRRERFLTPAEIGRLCAALNRRQDSPSAACIAFLLLTGARRGEALTARWRDFDPAAGVWTKPSAHTKQKRVHRVPLSAAASAVLVQLAERFSPADPPADEYVFGGPEIIHPLRAVWEPVREEAGLPDVRLHDLRHAFASVLASGGLSLPIIGALLGHSTPVTTARYAHLLDGPLCQATERVGNLWTALGGDGAKGEVVPLRPGSAG